MQQPRRKAQGGPWKVRRELRRVLICARWRRCCRRCCRRCACTRARWCWCCKPTRCARCPTCLTTTDLRRKSCSNRCLCWACSGISSVWALIARSLPKRFSSYCNFICIKLGKYFAIELKHGLNFGSVQVGNPRWTTSCRCNHGFHSQFTIKTSQLTIEATNIVQDYKTTFVLRPNELTFRHQCMISHKNNIYERNKLQVTK